MSTVWILLLFVLEIDHCQSQPNETSTESIFKVGSPLYRNDSTTGRTFTTTGRTSTTTGRTSTTTGRTSPITDRTSTTTYSTSTLTSFITTTNYSAMGSGEVEGSGDFIPDRLREINIQPRGSVSLDAKFPFEFSCVIVADVKSISSLKTTWAYKGKDVIPTRSSRIQTTELVQVNLNTYVTKLTFKEFFKEDNGEVAVCYAVLDNALLRDKVNISVPSTVMKLDHINVESGTNIRIECVGRNYSKPVRDNVIGWCKNGQPFKTQKGANITNLDQKHSLLTLLNVTESATYGCGLIFRYLSNECDSFAQVTVYRRGDAPCPEDVTWESPDDTIVYWEDTFPGHEQTAPCSHPMRGLLRRTCERVGSEGRWGDVDNSSCISENLFLVMHQVSDIQSGIDADSVENLLGILSNETNVIQKREEWQAGSVHSVLYILNGISNITKERKLVSSKQDLQNFATAVNNVLSPETTKVWNDQTPRKEEIKISSVMNLVTTFGFSAVRGLSVGNVSRVQKRNIVIEARRSDATDDISFYSGDVDKQEDHVVLRKETIINQQLKENGSVDYVAVHYISLSYLLPTKATHKSVNDSSDKSVSDILSIALRSGPQDNIDPPVELFFKEDLELQDQEGQPTCVFWDFNKDDWSREGCTLVNSQDDSYVCHCDHLTNFAILISPYSGTSEHHHKVLGIISITGCVFSLTGIILTIIVYIVVWRQLKSQKSVLLINLCVSLSIAILVFLLGVEQTQNKTLCAVVTGALHYLFLCTFFLMFAEGASVAISVVNVFSRRSYLKYFLPAAWGLPAIIVAITYGAVGIPVNDRFCWLSFEDRYFLLAFIIPALTVILANIIITIIVLRALFSTRSVMNRSQKDKIKTGLRSVAVLAPLFGLTWVFGIFSVNKSTVIFQYLFVLFNSLQGLFIFIFHCVLNKLVRDTLYNRCPCFKERRWGSVTSRTPLSNKADSKPTSESVLDSQQNTLTLESSHMRTNTTSSFSHPSRRKQDDISTEKETQQKMNDYVPMPNAQLPPQDDQNYQDIDNDLCAGLVPDKTEDTKL